MKVSENFCRKMINRFGDSQQINKVQEECMELALAITQKNCETKDPGEILEMIIDEIADVHIVIAQARLIYGADEVDKRIAEKICRATELYLREDA